MQISLAGSFTLGSLDSSRCDPTQMGFNKTLFSNWPFPLG